MTRIDMREALEKAGLKFEMPENGKYDFSAIQGKSCFGQLLSNPNFFDAAGIRAQAAQMPLIEKVPVGFQLPSGEWAEDEENFWLRDARTHERINIVSEGYNLTQDAELAEEMARAVEAYGYASVGTISAMQHRLHIAAVFADPSTSIKILHDYGRAEGRTIAGGFSFTNSYTGDLGINIQAIGIDTFCINFNPWGKAVKSAELRMTHLRAGQLEKKAGDFLRLALSQVGKVQKLYDEADEVKLGQPGAKGPDGNDALFLLAGAGFAEEQANYIVEMRERLEPAIADRPAESKRMTALTLNLAATAYATHIAPTSQVMQLRSLSAKAMKLLKADALPKMREEGHEIVKEWERAAKARNEAKEARKKATLLSARINAREP